MDNHLAMLWHGFARHRQPFASVEFPKKSLAIRWYRSDESSCANHAQKGNLN
jgi:hypothetical protein